MNETGKNPDQDAGPPGNGVGDVPHPDPDPDPAAGHSGEEADAPVDGDEVDEQSAESFPSSDPPAGYAGSDQPAD